MGWFDEQIRNRKKSDQDLFEDSFLKLAASVSGKGFSFGKQSGSQWNEKAIDELLRYYRKKPVAIDESIADFSEQLDYCLRPYGIMYRDIDLKKGFYKDAFGPILAFFKESKTAVCLLPDFFGIYEYTDPQSLKKVRVDRNNEGLFEEKAFAFYLPLPLKKLGIADLLLYMKDCVSPADLLLMVLASLAVSLIGMLTPKMMSLLSGSIVNSGNVNALYAAMVFMVSAGISSRLIGIVSSQITARMNLKISLSVQAAVMMRILSLPASFFRKYSSGELYKRSCSVSSLCDMLLSGFISGGIASLMSLLYVAQIFRYAPALVVPALLIVFLSVGFGVLSSLLQVSISRKQMELSAKESGMSFSLLNGIAKIRASGSEKRAFGKWADVYAAQAAYTFDPPLFLKFKEAFALSVSLFGGVYLYYRAVRSGMDQSSYFAFHSAYGMVSVAFSSLAAFALNFAQITPILQMAEPILKEVPENSSDREVITSISGSVEMSHVSFRYEEDGPYILDDLSLKINAGDYVAIVGKTGCGKSTLIRLLLGFETPEKGAVYYDKKDLRKIDPLSLRKKIGTVSQNGDLFNGDIYSNISICAPGLSMDDAWKAAEMAGIAEDIKAMPMGMFTMISEGARDISGGQKQRLMIARAIAGKPKLLIFDEATSALDNKTQKQVSDALDSLKCTRIVIAHRLSTIRHCKRILILDGGKIQAQGSYEELIENNPFFAELVKRQRLDLPEEQENKESDE